MSESGDRPLDPESPVRKGEEGSVDADSFDAGYFAANYRNYEAQNPERKLAFYHRCIREYLGSRAEAEAVRLLDVGCGLGRFLGYLAHHEPGWSLAGTDLSAWAVEQNRQRWPELDFRLAGATERPLEEGSQSVVTALDVLEHVPERDDALEAIEAMLAPGGLFVFVVPVYDGLSGPAIRLLDRDPTHVHKHGRAGWLAWAAERFEVLGWWGMLRYLLPAPGGGLYLHWPTRALRAHTPAILVACRRR